MQQQQQQRAQQPRQPQQPTLPAEVNILAVQNQLGAWKTEYKARLTILNARTVLVLSLIGILGGAGLVASDYLLRVSSSWGGLGIILLCGGLWLAINALLYYGLHVYTFTEGLVRVKGNTTDVIRWDQIKTIWNKVKNIQVNKGTLAINKDGQWLNWTSIKVSGIPNFPVFMSLVDYIMKST